MQSYLIISKDPKQRESEARILCEREGIDRFDIAMIERGEGDEKKMKPSLGIDDVKAMQQKLYLKPFRGNQKAVIIQDSHLLTIEAQNALLKVLEEPPENTLIILTAENGDALLPTVRSRVSIISLQNEQVTISPEEQSDLREIIKSLPQWEAGRALKLAEKLAKNKDDTLLWLEKMIIITRETLLSQLSPDTQKQIYYVRLLKSLQTTSMQIKTTNVNLRLALENLLLQ